MGPESMSEFWDARASEDARYFVDNRLPYGGAEREGFWEGGREVLDLVNEALGVELGAEDGIVEIGCGVGRITRELARRGGDVRALDVSARMLELAREANPDLESENVTWILGDGHSLAGIESASADVCHSFVVFQHIPDPEVTLGYVEEIGRVLRPGGYAAIQVSNLPAAHRSPAPGARLRARAKAALGRGPGGQDHPAWLGSAVGLGALRARAEQSGLELERVVGEGTQHCLVLLRAQ